MDIFGIVEKQKKRATVQNPDYIRKKETKSEIKKTLNRTREREAVTENHKAETQRWATAPTRTASRLPRNRSDWDQNDWLTYMISEGVPIETAFRNVSWSMPEELKNKHVSDCLIHQIQGGLFYDAAFANCKDWAVVPSNVTNGNDMITYLVRGGFSLETAYRRFMGMELPEWLKGAEFRSCIEERIRSGMGYVEAVDACQNRVQAVSQTVQQAKVVAQKSRAVSNQAKKKAEIAKRKAREIREQAKKLREQGAHAQANQVESSATVIENQANEAIKRSTIAEKKAQEAETHAQNAERNLQSGNTSRAISEAQSAQSAVSEAQNQAILANSQSEVAQSVAEANLPLHPMPSFEPEAPVTEEVAPSPPTTAPPTEIKASIFSKLKNVPKWAWIAILGFAIIGLKGK